MRKLSSTCYLIITLCAVTTLMIGLILGCDEQQIDTPVIGSSAGSGPVGGGDTQSLKLLASPSNTITAIGDAKATAQITALVENNIGQPMPDGTVVYWTATVGSLDSVTTTTSNGSSTVTLTFPEDYTGGSTVTATSGDVSGSIRINVVNLTATPSVTPTPTVTTTPTPATGFVISAADQAIDSGNTTIISAYVTKDGQPEANLQINFSVSGAGILSQSAGVTDSTGKASVTLTGNNNSAGDQTATVTASASGGRSGTVSVIVRGGATPTPDVTATPTLTSTPTATPTATPLKTFILSATPQSVDVSSCTAPNTSDVYDVTISADVKTDGVDDDGMQVNFTVVSGTALGALNANAAIVTSGIASVTFRPNCSNAGTVSVSAQTTDGRSGNIAITLYN